MTPAYQARGVHLTGSVSLANAEEVFRTAGNILGSRVKRVPDGETGPRSKWLGWQRPLIANHPSFEEVPQQPGEYGSFRSALMRLRDGIDPSTVSFVPMGYAEAAKASYEIFARLRKEGILPQSCRFQVCWPTPVALAGMAVLESRAAVEAAYEAGLFTELDSILEVVPAADLAVQWDVSSEFEIWEGYEETHLSNPRVDIPERLVRVGERIPAGVEMGYHLCYGSYEGRPFMEIEDTSNLVAVANAVCAGVSRPVNWIHMPVPSNRDDDAYFAPLRNLVLQQGTELYLGLVHITDGEEGTRRRIEAARRVVSEFGVSTLCGMHYIPPETIPELLAIHARVADPMA